MKLSKNEKGLEKPKVFQKKLIFLILFLNLIPIAMASTLLDDWVDDYETFKAGDHYFYVEYIESTQSLIFKMDDMGGIMSMGECETKENIKYCFEDVDYPKVKVKIDSLEPDISIERTFSTTTPSKDEQITVTVTLKNEGDKRASYVKYTDSYPAGLRVFADGNKKVWEGNLNMGEEETFKYTIKAEQTISFDSIATLTYKFDGNKKTIKSSTETIKVQKPYAISHSISKKAADKDEIVNYTITINNQHESNTLKVENLKITIPSKIDIVESKELTKENNVLTFKGEIEKEGDKNFIIKLKSSKVGKFTIDTIAELRISATSYKEELEQELSIGLSYIVPILNITNTVNSNSPYDVFIAVKNYGEEEIKNVNIKVESDLFDNIEKKRDIAAGTTYALFEKTLIAPYLEEEKKYNIKVSGSYISSSGKEYKFEKLAQLIVTAAPKIIEIIREFNKEEFYFGDEIKVVVRVKNLKSTAVEQVDVSDIFPKEIRSSLIGDVVGYLDELKPNEEKKLYSYSLLVPENYEKEEIEFKTIVNAKVDGELTILKKIDTIKILKGEKPKEVEEEQKIAAKEREIQKEEINKTEEEPKEVKEIKENFFTKILNWIRNLFRRKK